MTIGRLFDWFQLAVLGCLACLALARGLLLYARGVRVIVADRQRTPPQMLSDSVLVILLLLWLYELVAYAWPLPYHLVPPWLGVVLIDSVVAKVAGAITMIAGLVIYGLALWAMGDSWRLGIDRQRPGRLVTHGIFAWTRNPVYVGLELLAIGTFLVQGRLIFLVLALGIVALIHEQIRREERFLAQFYGHQYHDYCARVDRYATWRSSRHRQ